MSPGRLPTLRRLVLDRTGQDVLRCQGCNFCDADIPGQDIPFYGLVNLIAMNDEEVLTCHTVWSEEILEQAQTACSKNLNLRMIILSLREEAHRRGLVEEGVT